MANRLNPYERDVLELVNYHQPVTSYRIAQLKGCSNEGKVTAILGRLAERGLCFRTELSYSKPWILTNEGKMTLYQIWNERGLTHFGAAS